MPEINFSPFVWPDETPSHCPFPRSSTFKGLRFLGSCSNYDVADTWYPSWAENDILYSPWTDGHIEEETCWSGKAPFETGHAALCGADPLNLEIINLGKENASPLPYAGRYPGGSLVHNGIWYYSTYCQGPGGQYEHKSNAYNWPIMGPVPDFRISWDYGRTWTPSPLDPKRPLFPEPQNHYEPVKFGSPHFVDFGRNMEYSQDGKAYFVAHGTDGKTPNPRYGDNSWISGDQIYLARVSPSPETINNLAAWEFYSGYDNHHRPIWTKDFMSSQALLT